jgi:DNA-directed RNA polymerase subunit RPC12/RpoP
MSNLLLLTLTCPSCGAIFENIPATGQFTCKYCGSIHVLKDVPADFDANSVVCPLGRHQDLVLKVSTIIKTQVFDASGSKSEAPAIYTSALAHKLLCPPKPNFSLATLATREGILGFVLVFLLLFAFLGSMLVAYFFPMGNICGFILFFVAGAFIVIPIAKNTLVPVFQKKNATFQKKLKRWQITRNRWEHSYYCQKHDIVFMKGSQRAISLDDFRSFLQGEDK